MIKVLQVLEATCYGTGLHVTDLVKRIDKNAFDVSFVYSTERADTRFRQELHCLATSAQIDLCEIPMKRTLSISDISAVFSIYQYLRKNGPFDIVHLHSGKAGLLGRLACMMGPRWCKAVVYTPNAGLHNVGALPALVERALSRVTDVTIAVSQSEFRDLTESGVSAITRTTVIESGVDVNHYSHSDAADTQCVRSRLALAPGVLVVGSVGRLAPQKQPLDFVKLACSVKNRIDNVHFVWVGDGELRPEFERLAKTRGLKDSVTCVGEVTDVRPYLAAMDVFCLLSKYESFGYVTVEAMLQRKPVVATSVSGTMDIVRNGINGYLVRVGDIEAMTQRICELLESLSLRVRLGQAGYTLAKDRFSVNTMVAKTEHMYRLLVRDVGIAEKDDPA